MLSMLSIGSGMPSVFSGYATFVEDCIRKKFDWELIGWDPDEIKEVRNELWTIVDNYGHADVRSPDSIGEDEEP